jgi:hypothetical protein
VHTGVPAGSGWERSSDRAGVFLWSFLNQTPILEGVRRKRNALRDLKSCAARRDRGQRCWEGARRGRQSEELGRLACRPPAYRQGAFPPKRTLVSSGLPLEYPGVLTQLSKVEHLSARLVCRRVPSHRGVLLRARCLSHFPGVAWYPRVP